MVPTRYTYHKAMYGFGGFFLSLFGLFGSGRYAIANLFWLVNRSFILVWMSEALSLSTGSRSGSGLGSGLIGGVSYDSARFTLCLIARAVGTICLPILFLVLVLVFYGYQSDPWWRLYLSQLALVPYSDDIVPPFLIGYFRVLSFHGYTGRGLSPHPMGDGHGPPAVPLPHPLHRHTRRVRVTHHVRPP